MAKDGGAGMSDNDEGKQEETNGNRATLALVSAQVGEVKAIIAGNAALTNAKLDGMSIRIDAVAKLPERVARIEERTKALEDHYNADAQYRRTNLPALLISAGAFLATVANFLLT